MWALLLLCLVAITCATVVLLYALRQKRSVVIWVPGWGYVELGKPPRR